MPEPADPTRAMAVVELVSASKVYARGGVEVRALDQVSLVLTAGERVALIGPSGCGKSTCLNLLSGVDRADEGLVRVLGLDLARARESERTLLRRRRIGIVFQAFHLVPHLSVEENVALPLALDARRDDARVAEVLARVGLTARRRHYPSELSGGEQQRAAVARAIVHRPALLLADEPTGNLDSLSGAAVIALLDELCRAERTTLLVATHDERVAARTDRIVAMSDGRILAPGAARGPGG